MDSAPSPPESAGLTSSTLAQAPDSSPERLADAIFEAEAEAVVRAPLRRPSATYRLQMHAGFRLDDAARVVDYLGNLGISDCYLSPFLLARPGSTHGYDICEHGRINPEIGNPAAFDQLTTLLRQRRMGLVLNVVPNHMGIGNCNPLWIDLLEGGAQSLAARFFDVDWDPVKEELKGRILLPLLEDNYGNVLEAGLLELQRDGGSFWIGYHDHRLPLNPRSYARVLERRADVFGQRFVPDDDEALEYLSISNSARNLPARTARGAAQVEEVRREKEVIKRRLRRLCEESPRVRQFVDENVASFRGTPGAAESFDDLHALLEEQVYRLAYWRVASEEINYRRFFDVAELAGLRTEDPLVFDTIHALIFDWVGAGVVTALRIDHPDGLVDPLGYFRRLQEHLFLLSCRSRLEREGRGDSWEQVAAPLRARFQAVLEADPSSLLARRFPIVAEKILSPGERLPADWPIDGTVGYEYLNALNGLFVDPAGGPEIDAVYREFTGDHEPFDEALQQCKLLIEQVMLASEVTMLTRRLDRVTECDRRSRDFTLNELRRAVREVIACFRIYRTYLRPGAPVSESDRGAIEQAVARAERRRTEIDRSVFAFLRAVLLLETPAADEPGGHLLRERFTTRFQQTTGPIQAKGLEDTTFYRQVRLASLNEVGGDPSRFGTSPSTFHALNVHRLESWPGGLSATATHDTKRGEDTRMRINVLSELPDEWKTHLARWARWNARKKVDVAAGPAPDAREEILLYQTLIGAWPFDEADEETPPGLVERVQAYMVKAVREAKRNTSWTDPDPSYADAVVRFVADILEGPDAQPFLKDFLPFQRRVARVGVVHSLAQTLIKLASPGAVDIYQGCELWDLSLVNPDNRRPVDFAERSRLLEGICADLAAGRPRAEVARRLYASPADGAIKLYLIWTALGHRQAHPDFYLHGAYRALNVRGEQSGRVVAFARHRHGRAVLAVAPRLVTKLMGADATTPPLGRDVWGDTQLVLPANWRPHRWRDLLTDQVFNAVATPEGGALDLADLFQILPLALLVADPPAEEPLESI